MANPIFDEPKVEKLLETFYDFILGTKLTNAEIDYVINALWIRVMSNRVAHHALANMEALALGAIEKIDAQTSPNYIR